MTWSDKLKSVQAAVGTTPELATVFADAMGAEPSFIRNLRSEYPFVGEEYLSFLRQTDGAQIDAFELFGSGQSEFTSISEVMIRWKPIIGGSGLPIGAYPSGDPIVVDKDGLVRRVDYRMDSLAEGPVLARSFGEFISDMLMGSQFPMLFNGQLRPEDENAWTRFMRSQGWL